MTSVSRPTRPSSHFGSHFSSSQLRGSQIINIPINGFTAKKSVVLNDDEPRSVPIPKDFAHLMLRKIDAACFNISDSGECFCTSDCHLQFTILYFISSVVAYCVSPYASFYVGLSCSAIS